ncbi:MAG TPA: endonuclease MutS2 [Syntrophomonas sp.]|nr:endonuclease MutS2 [Syntrophomonas sp.]
MDRETLIKLEFDKIQTELVQLAYTDGAKEKIMQMNPSEDVVLVNLHLDETEEAMELLRFGEPGFLSSLKPVDLHLKKARVAGILSPGELIDVYHLLRSSRLAIKYIGTPSARVLKNISAGLTENKSLEQTITDVVDEEGQIRNDASSALRSIRKQIETSRLRIKDYLQNFIRSGNNQNLLQDALVTERAGRYVVPVKQEYRNEVKGIVHDESASGATVFIEPLPVVEHNNKIKSLQIEEQREIERILRDLSSSVSVFAAELQTNNEILENLDVIFARANLAYNMNAFRPKINNRGIIDLQKARHPLLGKQAVPVNISLGQTFDILVITGPNTGGKTVVLKTTGLLTIMAMCGLFVPAREDSQLSIFKNIYVDIGDEQSIEQSLSTFSSHMNNIIHILKHVGTGSLVLMDELGAGTDPHEGAALARAVLEKLKILQAKVIVTTHQSELKTFAYQNQRVENACVEFNPITLMPTYELTIGTPGQSNAFAIASRLGLDSEIVDQARGLVPEREREIGDMIRQLKESRYNFEINSRELEKDRRDLDIQRLELETERENLTGMKNEIIRKARQEADSYVRAIKREANEAIDELKEILKEKEKPPKWHEVEEKRRRLRDLSVNHQETEPVDSFANFKSGDYVQLKSIGQYGYVLEEPNNQGDVMVQIGAARLSVNREQLIRAQSQQEKPLRYQQSFLEKARSISPELDLRGKYAEEALEQLDKYLDDAALAGIDKVRIIHGKGTGALRRAVRAHLQNHHFVSDFRDGAIAEGGFGVTVITLK